MSYGSSFFLSKHGIFKSDDSSKRLKIYDLLAEIRGILLREGEKNLARNIEGCLYHISQPNGFEDCRSEYQSMFRAKCGFSDFYIATQDFNEQVRLNNEFENIQEELRKEFYPDDGR